ncbi:MAG: sugar phosphate isomerase/epimerase [Eubacteriales bacterium]|nr:sugar phosphate isomerase/epimerase [Eubacteriales bacterium]
MIQIAAPLFILRHDCREDLFSVLDRLHDLGFDGVEFLGFFGHEPAAIRDHLRSLSLTALGNHVPFDLFSSQTDSVIRDHLMLGCRYVTVSGPPKEWIGQPEKLEQYIREITRIGRECRQQGLRLLYHNHADELYHHQDSMNLLDFILARTPSDSMAFEPDLGWLGIAGENPEKWLDQYQDRCPVIHLKDYYARDPHRIGDISRLGDNRGGSENSFFEFRPTGYGVVNTPALMRKIINCRPDWLVADHDLAYERDPYQDLRLSLNYMRDLLSVHVVRS